jgi:hypothetical protein
MQNLVFANATLGMMPPPDSWGPNHCMSAEAPHTQWLKSSAAAAADMAAAAAAGASLASALCADLPRSDQPSACFAHSPAQGKWKRWFTEGTIAAGDRAINGTVVLATTPQALTWAHFAEACTHPPLQVLGSTAVMIAQASGAFRSLG